MNYQQQQQQRPARHSRQPPSYPVQQQYHHPAQISPPPPTSPPPGAYYGQPPRSPGPYPNITFQVTERGDRQGTLDGPRQRAMPSAYQNQFSPPHPDAETGDFLDQRAGVGRKKSLVKPDREKIEPGHRQWHYRTRVEQMGEDTRVGVQPSSTSILNDTYDTIHLNPAHDLATGNYPQKLRRGKSLLAREQDMQESGLSVFKRGATLRRKRPQSSLSTAPLTVPDGTSRKCLDGIGPGPKDCWFIYCYLVTCWIPPFMLSACGR